MPISITSPDLLQTISAAQTAASQRETKTINVNGQQKVVRYPFPSPRDWRDCCIYFLMVDRFANAAAAPQATWNQIAKRRQGGTFKGVEAQLGYIADLGAKAIWLSPVLKNAKPDVDFNYHGYGAQDFVNVDERFALDGTRATAEIELAELVEQAHGRGLYVIFDIVLNHAGRVFDYVWSGGVVQTFSDAGVLNGPQGDEPPIEWVDGSGPGNARKEWTNVLPAPSTLSVDDAVWPTDFQNRLFFRRRGTTLTNTPDVRGFVPGDFGNMRQLVADYDASVPGQETVRASYGVAPVMSILIRGYQYLMAKYDVDAYRIDTVKYVYPDGVRNFGNAMREYGLSIGKKNFFTFGEIYDNEQTIEDFVGRTTDGGEGFGIDAALDFPLFYVLPSVAKGFAGVENIRDVFEARKQAELGHLSSHGEAGRYFVTFLDNHDQGQRIQHPSTPPQQVTLALGLLFALQGIPCLYYGTEQGLSGTVKPDGTPDLGTNESVREALWGKTPVAFDEKNPVYKAVKALTALRSNEPALSYGRLYFREVSGNGSDFGQSSGNGGIVAFSRILVDREVLVVANTNSNGGFAGSVIVDVDINATPKRMQVAFSNLGTNGSGTVQKVAAARFFTPTGVTTGPAAALPVVLAANEVQILTPM